MSSLLMLQTLIAPIMLTQSIDSLLDCYTSSNGICKPDYLPVSCSCANGCGSWNIDFQNNKCHCHLSGWTTA